MGGDFGEVPGSWLSSGSDLAIEAGTDGSNLSLLLCISNKSVYFNVTKNNLSLVFQLYLVMSMTHP